MHTLSNNSNLQATPQKINSYLTEHSGHSGHDAHKDRLKKRLKNESQLIGAVYLLRWAWALHTTRTSYQLKVFGCPYETCVHRKACVSDNQLCNQRLYEVGLRDTRYCTGCVRYAKCNGSSFDIEAMWAIENGGDDYLPSGLCKPATVFLHRIRGNCSNINSALCLASTPHAIAFHSNLSARVIEMPAFWNGHFAVEPSSLRLQQ